VPFDSDDYTALNTAVNAGDFKSFPAATATALAQKLDKFGQVMSSGVGSEEEWKAAVELNDFQLPVTLGLILVWFGEGDSCLSGRSLIAASALLR
jgi:hypothetical protein